jgi:non-homologous end joining protein Ku
MKSIANTTIRLGLIALPVQVVKATSSNGDVSFSLCSPEGNAVEQVYRDKVTGNIVGTKGDCLKGVKVGQDIRVIDQGDLDVIAEQTKLRDLGIEDIVSMSDAMEHVNRIEGMYYIQMNGKVGSANTMKLFVDALTEEELCIVTKWTPRTRQELLVIRPEDGILVANSYSFASDVQAPDEGVRAHLSGTYTDAELQMARQLLQTLAQDQHHALDTAVDEAIPMRKALVDKVLNGEGVTPAQAAAPAQADQNAALSDALAQALAAAQKAKATA